MAGFRVRRALLGLIFAFAFTGYVQRTSISIAAERMMPELGLSQIQVGWRWALVVTSVPSLLLVVLWYTYARDRPDQHSAVTEDELRELAANPTHDAPRTTHEGSIRRILRDPQILLLTVSYFVMNYV